jgi:hypothetical protein
MIVGKTQMSDTPKVSVKSATSVKPKPPKFFPGAEKFIFDVPLYEFYDAKENDGSGALFFKRTKIEGFCRACKTRRVYSHDSGPTYSTYPVSAAQVTDGFHEIVFDCSMNSNHKIVLFLLVNGDKFGKVGQWPSLADVANDAAKIYSKVLDS